MFVKLALLAVQLLFQSVLASAQCGIIRSVSDVRRSFSRGDWPWMVALYEDDTFFCGGVLISKRKVLTAAHCIQGKNQFEPKKTEDIVLLLGAYDLSAREEGGVHTTSPSEVFMHEDWKPFHKKYDADIALVLLKEELLFTNFIKPICIGAANIETDNGVIAGWGAERSKSKNHEDIPRELDAPIWTNENCLTEFSHFAVLSSNRTLCAGGKNNSVPSNGDSGGGLYVKGSNGAYYLKGIISVSLLVDSVVAVYTNVDKFIKWIDATGVTEAPASSLTLNTCTPSATTVSGTHSPSGQICSGQLIFEENFNALDQAKWRHEISLANDEFQWYVNDRNNSFVSDGKLHLSPSFTSDIFGETFLTSGRVQIPADECTSADWYGCDRQGSPDNIINPIRSARLDTWDSFRFKFGTVEFRAKTPAGDWIWPALWMMPRFSVYGGWPRSGEIDVIDKRGNRQLYSGNTNVGAEQVGSTLHFGPSRHMNGLKTSRFTRNHSPGFDHDFHIYKVVWTTNKLQFMVDDVVTGTVNADEGFWKSGGFESSEQANPWAQGTIMAPFDQEFFLIMNLAVGGTNYFSDGFVNRNSPKPWHNYSPRAAADFWNARSAWESTWNRQHSDDSHMQVDWVRVWAL